MHLVDDEEGAREPDPAELGVGHAGHRAEGLVDRADRDPGGREHAALPLRPAERPALAAPDVERRDGCHVVVTGHGEHDLVRRDAEPHGEPADAVEDLARGDPGRQSEEQGVAKAEREQAGEQDEGRLGLAAAGGVLGAEQGARSDTDLEHRALQGRQRRLTDQLGWDGGQRGSWRLAQSDGSEEPRGRSRGVGGAVLLGLLGPGEAGTSGQAVVEGAGQPVRQDHEPQERVQERDRDGPGRRVAERERKSAPRQGQQRLEFRDDWRIRGEPAALEEHPLTGQFGGVERQGLARGARRWPRGGPDRTVSLSHRHSQGAACWVAA